VPTPAPTPTPTPAPAPTPVPAPSGAVQVYVTDAPPRDEVKSIMVTVSEVKIHKAVAEQEREQEQSSTDNQTQEQEQEQQQTQQDGGEWLTINLSDNATTFDLLTIKGIEQFLGASQAEAGKYTQIRLVVDKVEVTLGDKKPQEAKLPSNELKLVRPFDVVAGETTVILLDFEADKMVTVTGAGNIMVKPVIKLSIRQEKSTAQDKKPQPTTTEQASIEVSCNDFMETPNISRELEVAVGEVFTVTLCSNPTTGFQWSESVQISDPTVLEQVDHKFVAPEAKGKGNKPPAPGTPSQEIWTFKALKEGESTISMEYSRPWEGGEKGEWTFVLTVTVK